MTTKQERPPALPGTTQEIKTSCGPLFVIVNRDGAGRPFEIFLKAGKAGGCLGAQCEALGRMVSLVFRLGGTPEHVIPELKGISCHKPKGLTLSCADAVAGVLSCD